MHLSYNDVEFRILSITDFSRQAVYTDDETTYLFDHVSIRCKAYVNVDATSIDQNHAPSTVNRLVYRLLQPRRTLRIWTHESAGPNQSIEVDVLLSPEKDKATDARFGPICKIHRLDTGHGLPTIIVDAEFQTDICPIAGGIVLSNRWAWRTQYTQNYQEQIIIEGEAIVRMDNLLKKGLKSADDLRGYIVPPVSDGMTRMPPMFELSSGGNSIRYVIIDEENMINSPKSKENQIADIAVTSRRAYTCSRQLEAPSSGRGIGARFGKWISKQFE